MLANTTNANDGHYTAMAWEPTGSATPANPSVYHGSGNQSPLLNLPPDVLKIIVGKVAEQPADILPLRFVCKRLGAFAKQKQETVLKDDLILRAIGLGSTSLVAWYRDRLRYPLTTDLTDAAARDGNLTMLQWLRENQCPWDVNTCAEAARGGHLAVMQWAAANGCPRYRTLSDGGPFGWFDPKDGNGTISQGAGTQGMIHA